MHQVDDRVGRLRKLYWVRHDPLRTSEPTIAAAINSTAAKFATA